jgi:hypothetical protein
MPVVYDVGALRAVERRSARMLDLHRLFLTAGSVPLLPTIVLGQLWRGLPRAATLTRVLKGCRPQVLDVITAKLGGQLCGLAGTSDLADAVLALARYDAPIVTSDPWPSPPAGNGRFCGMGNISTALRNHWHTNRTANLRSEGR